MKKQTPLVERLMGKLEKLGIGSRKAKELAKGLKATVSKAPVKGTVTGKLTARLMKLGLTERKATELAKALAPLVRASLKAKVRKAKQTLDDVDDQMVEDVVADEVDLVDDPELDKVAPRVNGHRVRLDLPVASFHGERGLQLLRVMHGYSSSRTYLVASVKGAEGLVAVRQFGDDHYNVKFYPHMRHWNKTQEELASLGAHSYLQREWYQRMHMNRATLDQVLRRLATEAKPKSRLKALVDRFMTVTAAPLIKAFDYLHNRVNKAA